MSIASPEDGAVSLRPPPFRWAGITLRLMVAGVGLMVLFSCGSDNLSVADTQGTIGVGATTIGEDFDRDGYTVALNNGRPDPIGLLDTIYLTDIQPGNYTVRLAGIAPNCAVGEGANPQTATVVAADTVQIDFEVTCETIAPPGDGGGGDL